MRAALQKPRPGSRWGDGAPAADNAVLHELRSRLMTTLAEAMPADRSVVLMDIPRYANVGDNAILLGELAALRALGRSVLYVPADPSTPTRELRRRIGSRPILLQGGGTLGDLWPAHQVLRERVLTEFPNHRVVQLPQSIAFSKCDSVARARSVFERHRAFTLLVRDERSRGFAASHLSTPATLVPDAAFALGPLRRRGRPSREILLLARTDHEARRDRRLPHGVATEDWNVGRMGLRGRILHRITAKMDHPPDPALAVDATVARAAMTGWAGVSRDHLRRGVDLLCSAEVVVTDRLHAHVLCLLLGIPHVVTDNANGKVRALYDTWTSRSPLVTWAETLEDGVEIACSFGSAERAES